MSPHRILFCDDDPDIREIIALALGLDPDIEVKACDSAGELLATTVAWGPDLVLLDVMMPEMDGPTALAMLSANPCTRSIPVVFMTARTQAYECERFISLGAAGVIAKPFDPMTLAALARRYLSGAPAAPGHDQLRAVLARGRERLAQCRADLLAGADPLAAIASAREVARGLVAATDLCGFCGRCGLTELNDAARALADAAAPAEGDDVAALLLALDRFAATEIPRAA